MPHEMHTRPQQTIFGHLPAHAHQAMACSVDDLQLQGYHAQQIGVQAKVPSSAAWKHDPYMLWVYGWTVPQAGAGTRPQNEPLASTEYDLLSRNHGKLEGMVTYKVSWL